MDAVRFGKALGVGARGAARALAQAAEAAAATPPTAAGTPSGAAASRPSAEPVRAARAGAVVTRAVTQATSHGRLTQKGLARGTQRFGEAAWAPIARLSGVLWLEITGVFFGLFLLTAVMNAWRLREAFAHRVADPGGYHRLIWSVGMAVVFGYFCASSFVRARRREQGVGRG